MIDDLATKRFTAWLGHPFAVRHPLRDRERTLGPQRIHIAAKKHKRVQARILPCLFYLAAKFF